MDAQKVIVLARKHSGNAAVMISSARLCLSDAVHLYDAGNFDAAKARAIKSLGYSVGVFHEDYKKATR